MKRLLKFLPLILLGSCNGSNKGPAPVVTADGFELAAGELNQILRQLPPTQKELVVPTRRAVLDDLIAMRLLGEEAKRRGLDKQPEFIQQQEAALRALLASAYVQTLVADLAPPTDLEAQQFLEANPQLFSRRLKLTFGRIVVSAQDLERVPNAEKTFKQGGLAALSAALTAKGVDASPIAGAGATDAPPFSTNPRLVNLKDGDTITFSIGSQTHFLQIKTVENAPISPPDNLDPVRALILNMRRRSIVEKEVQRLKTLRKVEIHDSQLK